MLVTFLLIACRSADIRVISGKTVHKVTEYYSAFWGLPFHDGVSVAYWVYADSYGKQIKHGPYQTFYGNGHLEYEANFVDGIQDGTATRWDVNGGITGRTFWRAGKQIGWANYDKGQLIYSIESIFEDEHKVATRKFERGAWSLQFVCGSKVDVGIEASSGELNRLKGPAEIACQ
jgi:hypothetical protein